VTRIGLVLGAGGLTGTAFHAGVLTALAEDVGWDARDAELIVGTSAGSTTAALMRAGFPPRDYLPRILGQSLSAEGEAILGGLPPLLDPEPGPGRRRGPASPELLRAAARRPWRYRPGVVVAGLLPAGDRPVDQTGGVLRPLFDAWPERPLWVCAVRLTDGVRVVFGRDATAPVADAVSASCAVPGYFEPVEVNGQPHVDGGVYSFTNLDLVAGLGLDLVVVSAPLGTTDWLAPDAGNLLRVTARAQLEREASQVRRLGTRVLLVQPDARLRRVMGTHSMAAASRPPVARAARDHAARVLRETWPYRP
jgi:NTE family protein